MISRKIRTIVLIILITLLGCMVVTTIIYALNVNKINEAYYERYGRESLVTLRKFPYPYRAAMAISSDICGTKTLEEFLEIHRFINSREMTSMGEGIGLEIGNSFFFYDPRALSYFSENPEIAEKIVHYIRAGSIDSLHSYGKKVDFTREDAIKSLGELRRNGCKINVWTDHERSVSNLGDDVTFGLGDHPESKAYHADLTLSYGIKFAWLGRVTMITGQSVPISIRTFIGIYDPEHPIRSLINISKEFSKNVVAVFGSKKYTLHKENELLKITTLDDGQKIYEFIRFDNYWQGVSTGAFSKGLAYVISRKTLDRLKETEGYMIVYTHLDGRFRKEDEPFIPLETQSALRKLAYEYRQGNIYVTTTSKLLNYYINHRYLNWSYETKDGEMLIQIHNIRDPIFGICIPTERILQGITFYVADSAKARVFIGGKELDRIQRNGPDHTGRESVTICLNH